MRMMLLATFQQISSLILKILALIKIENIMVKGSSNVKQNFSTILTIQPCDLYIIWVTI